MKNLNYLLVLLLTILNLTTINAQHTISGKITCLGGTDGMEGEEVHLSGTSISDMVSITDVDGNYSFTDLPTGENYAITITKNENPLNGVSTFDMVKIFQYILNVEPWPSPFHMLAADVNNSGSVSTLDLVVIRQLILGLTPSFPNASSWSFATADYDPTTASGSVGGVTVNDLQADEVIDFVGVKIGDINGSAVCD